MSDRDAGKSIKSRIAGLKRGRRFIDYYESAPYAGELERLLDEIDRSAVDPRRGVELVAAFIQTDNAVLGRADDSDGSIGDVYRIFACDSFIRHASQCEDKEWLYNVVLKLYAEDEYGVRDSIIANATEFLPESYLRRMVDKFWPLGKMEAGELKRYHWYLAIESIARQLKDPELFERASRAKWPELPVAGHLDIAEVYFECGYPLDALQLLDKVSPDETFQLDEREQLLLKVLTELGEKGRAEEIAWRILRRSRSKTGLSRLLNIIGESEHERVVDNEIKIILKAPTLDYVDASFLFELERYTEAERYLSERSAQLNGDYYYQLLPWAKTFEKQARFLVGSIIYRALLDSILSRAKSKYYPYGVRYLRKLDNLAPRVSDWGNFVNHEDYKLNLRIEHKLKRSFWTRYDQ
ncbi:MAG TPA: hypothetical protein VJ983_02905 [candidate division Zixibacteria bacterium]|nr:hypothetical protein [candidate division Zixibacteria bacterium]